MSGEPLSSVSNFFEMRPHALERHDVQRVAIGHEMQGPDGGIDFLVMKAQRLFLPFLRQRGAIVAPQAMGEIGRATTTNLSRRRVCCRSALDDQVRFRKRVWVIECSASRSSARSKARCL